MELTYKEKALDINSIPKLDYILITHEHPDHMYVPFLKELIGKFPNVQIISNESVAKILKNKGLNVSVEGEDDFSLEEVPHEKALVNPPPQNVLFTVFNKLTHPGDSLSYAVSAEVLAMPIVGSWASTTACLDQAIKAKPKIVIPIHDWHWKDEARKWYYQKAKEYLKQSGIDFKSLETNEVIEV